MWPRGITVGHTNNPHPRRVVLLNGTELSPAEARTVADELRLRADYQDRTPDTFMKDGLVRRSEPMPGKPEGGG